MATSTAQTTAEQYESACAMAASLYEQGADTTEVDALVDRLLAQLIKEGKA